MNQRTANLLALPNEILFFILRKLDNIDVLYSLLNIDNQRLASIVQDQIFTNALNFVSIAQSTNEISSISDSILDRFCDYILPRVHDNIKSLTVESVSMECILRARNYPNLTELKLYNFNKATVSRYFMDDSLFGHNYKQQITDLILVSNENNIDIGPQEYTKNVYAIVLAFFDNLKHLSIVEPFSKNCPRWTTNNSHFSLNELPSITFSSLTLTKLCVTVNRLTDVYALLDGRLKQLTTLIVEVKFISIPMWTSYSTDDLPNLKCFSLTCYSVDGEYDVTITPLLRRMSHLEELTLFLNLSIVSRFISSTDIDNEILIHMPQLHTFTFYIESLNGIGDPAVLVSAYDIGRTVTNIKHQQLACMMNYCDYFCVYRIFSLPTKFKRLENIANNLPNIIFNSVTHVKIEDNKAFKHEFFVRLARAFPFLKNLSISNIRPPFLLCNELHLRDKDWCSIIEYSHLIFLDVKNVNPYYVEVFLNETKTYLPCLTKLKVTYDTLKMVTQNFKKDEMRCNCSRVKQLNIEHPLVHPENVYRYFPSL